MHILLRRSPVAIAVLAGLLSNPVAAQPNLEFCEQLKKLVNRAGDTLKYEFEDADAVSQGGDDKACQDYLGRTEDSGGISADEKVNRSRVVNEDEASIDAEVEVSLPDPEVDVQQDPANVRVKRTPPDVTVRQSQPRIVIRQARPVIDVELAHPTITVEQPAPEITVTMPEPGVDVASAEPLVEVVIPEPRVTVRQGQPSLSVGVDGGQGDQAKKQGTVERSDEGGGLTVEAAGLSGPTEPANVQFNTVDMSAGVKVKGTKPNVSYEAAKPKINVKQPEGKPKIDVVDSGDPKVMVSMVDQAPAGSNAQKQSLAGSEQRDPSKELSLRSQIPDSATEESVKVNALADMDVVNAKGKELGSVDRVVKNGSETFVIVQHGGWFLGLNGKEIALPIEDTFIKQEQVVLKGLTQQQIEKLPEYSYENEVSLKENEAIDVMQAK